MKAYNDAPALTTIIAAGTEVWRVHSTESSHLPNSFNQEKIPALVDAREINLREKNMPRQGRFDPVHDKTLCPGGEALGGYLYVGLTSASVVGEGILRSVDVPRSKVLASSEIAEKSLTRMVLREDICVATFDKQDCLAGMNLSSELTSASWRDYRDSRITCTKILVNTPDAFGVRYRPRNGQEELAFMFIDRWQPTDIEIKETGALDGPGWAYDLVASELRDRFGIRLT